MIDVSVVMPCLNEEATVGRCIDLARQGLERAGLSGEIIVADNGSTDGSAEVAESRGARVVGVSPRGYGHAYRGGIAEASGRVIVIGDSDGTYDFSKLGDLVRPLKDGAELVLGSRLRGSIQRGAMPWLHRYVGNPFLSTLLNRFYRTRISDAHSGFRAFTRDAYERLGLRSGGMEFASEMLIVAAQMGMRIVEVPISYQPRIGESKLRSFRDGWRHLRLLLLCSPRHLFTIPGIVMAAIGMALLLALLPGPIWVRGRLIDYHFMFVGALLAILGVQVATLGLFARSRRQAPAWFTLERGLLTGLVVLVAGFGANLYILWEWIASGFGPLNAVRNAIAALTLTIVGAQVLFSSFYLDLLGTLGPLAGQGRSRAGVPPTRMTDAPDRLPRVSVVIAARDSAATLPSCLTSLRALDYPSFDVIVADDGSQDETAEVARQHGAIVVETGGVGPSAARNAGVARSSAPVVAFTDADCTVTPQWLRALVEALGRSGAGSAGGPQLNVFRHPEPAVNAAIDAVLRVSSVVADYTRRGGEAREVAHNASCNSAYRRPAFEAVGGFRIGLWPAEDVDLDHRLRAAGYRCYYATAALVTHHRPGGRRWFARMMRRYGRGQGQLVRTHGVIRPVQAIPFLVVLAGASQLLLWPVATRPILLAIDMAVVSLAAVWYAWTIPPRLWLPVARVAVRALVEWHLGFAAGLAHGPRAASPAVRPRSR